MNLGIIRGLTLQEYHCESVRFRKLAGQIVGNSSSVDTGVTWDYAEWNQGGFLVLPRNKSQVILPAPGIYELTAGVDWSAVSGSVRFCRFLLNGLITVGQHDTQGVASFPTRLTFSPPQFYADGGDVLTMVVRQTTAGNLTLGVPFTYLSVNRVGALPS